MVLVTAGYTLGTILCADVRSGKRLMVFLGCFALGIPYFFVGPDKFFTGSDDHLWVTFVSQFVMGVATPPVYD